MVPRIKMMTSTYSNERMWQSGAPLDTGDDEFVYPEVSGFSPFPSVVAVRPPAVFHHGEVALSRSFSDPVMGSWFQEWLGQEYREFLAQKERQQRALHSIAAECAANASVTFYACSCCGERTYTQVDDGIRRCIVCVNMVELHEPEWGGEEVDELCCCNGCARGFRCDAPGMTEEYYSEDEIDYEKEWEEEQYARAEYGIDYDW
jgi:hypothetical protein